MSAREPLAAEVRHLLPQTDAEWFAYLAEHTRAMWKPLGYHVHVSTNERRLVVMKEAESDNEGCECDRRGLGPDDECIYAEPCPADRRES